MDKYFTINMIKQSMLNDKDFSFEYKPLETFRLVKKSDNKLNNRTRTMTLFETKLSDELANPIRPTARV